jgi:uncharacterized protein (TIGR03067 family)
MKRFVAWLLVLGIVVVAGPMRADDEKKDKAKTEEKKKDDKKDEKKKDEKKSEKPKEEKLTDEQKKELEKLTGTFTVTTFERDGKPFTADQLKKMKVVQKGAEWSFHDGDDITTGKDTVFPEKKPKEINSLYTNGTARDKTVLGIYEINNDSIKYCWAEPGKDRPKEFKSGPDITLMVLQRAKDGKESEKEKVKEKKEEKKKEEKKEEKKEKDKE